ncbi:hypothetical protein CXG81DRAFT_11923 [Caulochytrium protostelioides]|uniref:Patatin-domain-containing protein n=1 Tax=Caulochytrium protostelioides TaxID=1555241 RepID=A0A4P9WVQ7_9FUNG|nr:patatin-domain-containing protein [Caulochytrium protostelioides]RKP01454.1 hypothetical protein CXG81DRAFT_11923 [Caulochytrium protostelioides]|eukprot:RKP01454.1 hypothetical protein CXG81DRAFT_11923 [Caulochytrium protostelioides]
MGRLLQYPLLLGIVGIMSLELVAYFLVRQWVIFCEWAFTWRGMRKVYRDQLRQSRTQDEWNRNAQQLDQYLGNDAWRYEDACPYYDVELVEKTVRRIRRYRLELETNATLSPEERAYASNLGGIENEALYSHTYFGSKLQVERYVSEVCLALEALARCSELSTDAKLTFFENASRTYGRSALCLSGGASVTYYHIGVVKALIATGNMPKVITGTSGGAYVAAMIAVRTDDELRAEVFTPDVYKHLTIFDDSWLERFRRWWQTGAMFDPNVSYQRLPWITKGPLTFMEAYRRTGRTLCISVSPNKPHSPPKLLNWITSPDVVIGSAVMASSAIPGFLRPVELIMKTASGDLVPWRGVGKRWRDGSLQSDVPERELHQLFDVSYTIVSQVNPHIRLFFFEGRGASGMPTAHRQGRGWRGGFIASTVVQGIKLDLLKWLMLLRDAEILPRFMNTDWSNLFTQRFEGNSTIIPGTCLRDHLTLLTSPTYDDMARYINGGELDTWPKLHMIQNRMRIESTIKKFKNLYRKKKAARLPPTPVGPRLDVGSRS